MIADQLTHDRLTYRPDHRQALLLVTVAHPVAEVA